ncbi:unnamed protein product [Linum tenue]|uniref:Uncharacterized protein n=1 Tax=Linum tenue TaxID=586396 RepID=A0AAV0KPE1_9ROSI|nr:unnamed protein product [Linum tenue]
MMDCLFSLPTSHRLIGNVPQPLSTTSSPPLPLFNNPPLILFYQVHYVTSVEDLEDLYCDS